MIVMREILNVKQTQVHPRHPNQGWRRRLSSKALLATWPGGRMGGTPIFSHPPVPPLLSSAEKHFSGLAE